MAGSESGMLVAGGRSCGVCTEELEYGNAARRATREKIRLQREQERKRERRRRQVTITLSVVGVVVLIVAMVAIWQSTRNRSEGYAGELAPNSRTAAPVTLPPNPTVARRASAPREVST